MSMEEDGMATEDAVSRIWMVDSKGLIVKVSLWTAIKDTFCY